MPVALTLRVTPLRPARLRLHHCPAQGFFLALVQAIDSAWSKRLHQSVPVPGTGMHRTAYSVAPLYFAPPSPPADEPAAFAPLVGVGERLQAGQTVSLRVGLTNDADATRLLAGLPNIQNNLPPLGGAPCRIEAVPPPHAVPDANAALRREASDPVSHPDVLWFSWETLAQTQPAPRIHFDFMTPATFKTNGRPQPICEPERLWASWAATWEAFAPFALRDRLETAYLLPPRTASLDPDAAQKENAQALLPQLTVHNLYTETIRLDDGRVTGFVGWAEFAFHAGIQDADRQRICAIATIADFLGTGAKTAMGLGQTRCTLMDAAG